MVDAGASKALILRGVRVRIPLRAHIAIGPIQWTLEMLSLQTRQSYAAGDQPQWGQPQATRLASLEYHATRLTLLTAIVEVRQPACHP